jgi:hypothetical protein
MEWGDFMTLWKWIALVKCCREKIRESFVGVQTTLRRSQAVRGGCGCTRLVIGEYSTLLRDILLFEAGFANGVVIKRFMIAAGYKTKRTGMLIDKVTAYVACETGSQ